MINTLSDEKVDELIRQVRKTIDAMNDKAFDKVMKQLLTNLGINWEFSSETIRKAAAYFLDHYDGLYVMEECDGGTEFYYSQIKLNRGILIEALSNLRTHAKFAYNFEGVNEIKLFDNDEHCVFFKHFDQDDEMFDFDLTDFYNPYIPPEYYRILDRNEELNASKEHPIAHYTVLTKGQAKHFDKMKERYDEWQDGFVGELTKFIYSVDTNAKPEEDDENI